MNFRLVATAAVLLLAACSKSELGTATTTSAPASALPTSTAVAATGAATHAPAPRRRNAVRRRSCGSYARNAVGNADAGTSP